MSTSTFTNLTIAIGDPVSFGAKKARRLTQRGHEVVELRTFSEWIEYFRRSHDPSLFSRTVQHRGDDNETLAQLDGVRHILHGAESSIPTVDRLNHLRGDLRNDFDRLAARVDKAAQADALAAAGIPIVRQRYFPASEESAALAEMGDAPKVLKEPAGGGTHNVFLAKDTDEFRRYFRQIIGSRSLYDRPNPGVLVQDYIPPAAAREIVVDMVSHPAADGGATHVVTDCWEYEKQPMNGTPAMYRSMRLLTYDECAAEIDLAVRINQAVGYRQGASHHELWRLEDPAIIAAYGTTTLPVETGFRLPGLITEVAADATGRDQIDLDLDTVLDPEAFALKARRMAPRGAPPRSAAVVFLSSARAGRLTVDPPLEAVRTLRSFHASSHLKAQRLGDPLAQTVDVGTLAGWVCLCHDDDEVVRRDVAQVRSLESQLTNVD